MSPDRRSIAAVLAAAVLFTSAACGTHPPTSDAPTSGTPTANAPATIAPTIDSSTTRSATADTPTTRGPSAVATPSDSPGSSPAGQSSSAPASTSAPTQDVISVPAELGLPVDSLPLMPGATVQATPEVDGPGTISFKITNDGKTGRQVADWYYAAIRKAGFDVASSQYSNGGFRYEGKGVTGDSASTTSSFIIGMSKAGS